MPEVDGIEVMRRLAQMDHTPRLILMSGQDTGVLLSAEKLGRAHNLEILASLVKPIRVDKFRQLLEQHSVSRTTNCQRRVTVPDCFTSDELRHAIFGDQLILHYQPQIEIATERLIGVVALVRWKHPDQGMVYPDRFIHIAEQDDLMAELTYWVIKQAVNQQHQWKQSGFSVPISINISASDITSLTLPEQFTKLMTYNKLNPSHLTLEKTENALMGELVTLLDILTHLRLKGIKLSIDDFGTGYSSLSQLHRVPFTELKIDHSFVSNMTEDVEARAIVKTCIVLGHELDLQVVAEGVETKTHLDLLKRLGCDRAQGFFISDPMSGPAMTDKLG